MISNFKLKFGRVPSGTAEQIAATAVTVFVGPNNSGKSRILREIERFCRTGQKDANALLLEDVSFIGLHAAEIEEAITKLLVPPARHETTIIGHTFIGSRYGRHQVPLSDFRNAVKNPSQDLHRFCAWFLTHNTLILDGSTRIGLVADQAAGDLQMPAQSSLQVLFRDDVKRHEVRRIVYDAFGTYFVIDPTNLGFLRIRLASRAPRDELEERGLHAEAVQFQAAALPIVDASDGVKAFTGILTEVIAGDPSVILIDEPEAFLHPSLASKLGFEVSKAALSAEKRVFASSHSPAFVMGCIQSRAPVNIVRLTYREEVATARILPSAEILELMRHPLLRSTGVLSALFYEFVIVTESDADRAFYQEINERLLQFKPEWGIPNCLFINAQNKQTVQTIIRPLRKLGIPAAGIVDIDVLKDGGTNWTNLLCSAGIPSITHGSMATMRSAVKTAMDQTGRNMKRDGGLSILPVIDREAAENLLGQLADYGIFIVPGGELESWMKHLAVSGHGPTWLINLFERMGEDSLAADFVKPTNDDVWKFVSQAKAWLVNPTRKGIPS